MKEDSFRSLWAYVSTNVLVLRHCARHFLEFLSPHARTVRCANDGS